MYVYGFLPVIGISLVIYFSSYILTKTEYLKFTTHRRIWNLLLLVSFIIAGTMGLYMSFVGSFELDIEIPEIILKIHAGFGMIWFVIAFFHFFWHLNYFKKAIKVLINSNVN